MNNTKETVAAVDTKPPCNSLIGAFREGPVVLRVIVGIVILAFGGLVTSPAVAAVRQEASTIQWHHPDDSAAKLSAALHGLHTLLGQIPSSAATPQVLTRSTTGISATQKNSLANTRSELRSYRDQLASLDRDTLARFASVKQHLQQHHLPQVILDRQAKAVATYKTRMTALMTELNAAEAAPDAATFRAHALQAKTQLDQQLLKPAHEKFDPKHLPFSVAKVKHIQPRLSKRAYQLNPVVKPKSSPVALNGMNGRHEGMGSGDVAPAGVPVNPNDPSYLAPTDDVQITPVIQALAKQLNNNPVEIYNWVHNNIEYIPTYGSIQGSDMTLQTLRGNDFDTASLLIALLRASNIPARYVYGTIQVPINQVENWVGGVTDPNAALNLLGQGGVPVTGLAQGGQIIAAQMEHVWVEAWVNFIPARGAKAGPGNTWVPMDASFKQYTYTQGMNLQQAVPFDASAFAQQALATGQVDPAGNWVQGINQGFVQNAITTYQNNLWTYVQSQNATATVADVFGSATIISRQATTLAASLPYSVLSLGSRMTALPTSLQAHIQLALYASQDDVDAESPSFSQSFSLPDLAGKRVALVYQPATPADQAVIDTAGNNQQSSFPAYLVNVVPVIEIEGQTVWAGPAEPEGTEGIFEVTASYQDINDVSDYDVTAGDLDVLGFDPAGVTPAVWNARTQADNLSNGSITDYPTYMQELLYQTILSYWGELDAFTEIAGKSEGALAYRLPSFGMAEAPLSVRYNFGIAQSATYKSRVLDVREIRTVAENLGGNQPATVAFAEKLGYLTSYLESGVCDQIFALQPGYSMSAVSALGEADKDGDKIYHITAANISSILGQLSVSGDVTTDIQNAVNAGMEAYVPQQNISVGGFTGTGYILIDPATGSGAFKISGGRDGNNSPAAPNVYPLPQVPATPVVGIMVGMAFAGSGARLAVNASGIIQGIEGIADTPYGALLLALLALVVLIIAASQVQVFNDKYPPTNLLWRKYAPTISVPLIVDTGVVFQTPDGDFGPGVYFADPAQEVPGFFPPVNPGVSCPPSGSQPLQIATAYNLPRSGQPPEPTLAGGYVDIRIIRANYFLFNAKTNNHGAIEIVVYTGLIPYPEAKSGYAMPIGPFSLFAEIEGACF